MVYYNRKCFIFFLIFFVCLIIKAENTPVKLTLILNDTINKEDQWAYWISAECNLVDSFLVKKGEKLLNIERTLLFKEDYVSFLYFEKNGPSQVMLILKSGDDVVVDFTKEMLALTPFTKNSATVELYEYALSMRSLNINIKRLKELQEEQVDLQWVKDSIEYYNEQREKLPIDLLKNTISPSIYKAYMNEVPFLNQDSLIAAMKERFPCSKIVQQYPEYPQEYKDATLKKKDFKGRVNEIIRQRYKRYNYTSSSTKNGNSENRNNSILRIGDKIEDVSLVNTKGEIVSLNSITIPYILIDFWAAWCAPCRREIPHLKEALEANKEKLAIYAISLDNTKREWKNTILSDKCEMFTHVYGGNMITPKGKELCNRFGITSIPANFLLDKDRRIIAINLRGKELIKKMNELTKK